MDTIKELVNFVGALEPQHGVWFFDARVKTL